MIQAPSRARFVSPDDGAVITVDLPGERVRCKLVRRVSDEELVVELLDVPMTREHLFRQGDKIPVRLEQSNIGSLMWKSTDYREFLEWQREQRAAGGE